MKKRKEKVMLILPAKVIAAMHKCLVKMQKALNLCNKGILREKRGPHSHKFYYSVLL